MCSEMIHLMQLPDPDTRDPELRPQHGGRDRHFCIGAAAAFDTCVSAGLLALPHASCMSSSDTHKMHFAHCSTRTTFPSA